MKRSIILSAVCLALGIGVCSTASAKPKRHHNNMDMHQQVSIIPLRQEPGFAVRADKQEASRTMVIIYDNDGYPIFKDMLTDGMKAEKKYNLEQLDAGNYSLEVFSRGHDVKTNFYVYDKNMGKVIFVK